MFTVTKVQSVASRYGLQWCVKDQHGTVVGYFFQEIDAHIFAYTKNGGGDWPKLQQWSVKTSNELCSA